MTSLLPPSATSTVAARRSAAVVSGDLAARRPMALLAAGGGVLAAGSTLVVCMALGLVGWYLTDGGSHGSSVDGVHIGALGWLMGHGSGVRIEGTPVTAVPLGLTLVIAWTIWRIALRLGHAVAGHGPDADALADGDRDWTVPVATGLFATGYVTTAVLVAALAGGPDTAPSMPRIVLWSLLLCLVVGGSATAIGSGRAATWAALLPLNVRASVRIARRIVVTWLVLGLLMFLVALGTDLSTAANVLSQLHADTGAAVSITGLSLLVAPNAVGFAGSYLLGPGFTVGTGTAVTSTAAVLGPVPAFPMLAALPEQGPAPGWTAFLVVLPPLVGFVSTVLVLRSYPTTRWEDGAVRGSLGGGIAGLVFGLFTYVCGGGVGPGRLHHVGPFVGQVVLHGVVAFAIGGVLAGLAVTFWQRHSMPVEITLDD